MADTIGWGRHRGRVLEPALLTRKVVIMAVLAAAKHPVAARGGVDAWPSATALSARNIPLSPQASVVVSEQDEPRGYPAVAQRDLRQLGDLRIA